MCTRNIVSIIYKAKIDIFYQFNNFSFYFLGRLTLFLDNLQEAWHENDVNFYFIFIGHVVLRVWYGFCLVRGVVAFDTYSTWTWHSQ